MPAVIDASVALSWCLPDEVNDYARRVLIALRSDRGFYPPIWPVEVINALIVAKRRARLSDAEINRAATLLGSIGFEPLTIDLVESLGQIRRLSEAHGLTTYDASYLHLALREGLPLATIDDRLGVAARAAGCSVFEPPD